MNHQKQFSIFNNMIVMICISLLYIFFIEINNVTATTFPIYWNADESVNPPVDVTKYGFISRSQTQVGNSCSNPGCKSWKQGLFPSIGENGEIVNGGVPQAADLNKHLQIIEETLPLWSKYIPAHTHTHTHYNHIHNNINH